MTSLRLDNLAFIKDLNRTGIKTTSLYRSKTSSSIKDRFVVKSIPLPQKISKQQLVLRQAQAARQLKETNLIKQVYIDNKDQAQCLILIEQYQLKGNLTEMIAEKWIIDYELLANLAIAIQELHSCGIHHQNIKPENIFVGTANKIKLNDARITIPQKDRITQTASPYHPPQNKLGSRKSKQWDIWSLGVIFLELMIHRKIHIAEATESTLANLIDNIHQDNMKFLLKGMLCQQSERIQIGEIITVLQSKCKIYKRPHSRDFFVLKLPLFNSKVVQTILSFDKSEAIEVTIGSWRFAVFLLQKDSSYLLLVAASRRFSGHSMEVASTYSQMKWELKNAFSNWRQVFSALKNTSTKHYRLDQTGNLCIRIEIDHKTNIQQLSSIKLKEIQEQKKPKASQKVQQKSVLTKQQQNNTMSHTTVIVKQVEAKLILKSLDDEIIFQSDQEIDIFEAYRQFSSHDHHSKQAIELIKTIGKAQNPQTDLISTYYEELANQYEDLGHFQLAKKAYKVARRGYANKYGEGSQKQMNMLIDLGNVLARLREYEKAIMCYKKCIFLAQRPNETELLGKAYRNWGNIALHIRDYDTAEQCYISCIEQYSNFQYYEQQLLSSYTNLSHVYLNKEDYVKSNDCIKQYMKLNGQHTDEKVGILIFNWAFGLINLNQLKQALPLFQTSLKMQYSPSKRKKMEHILLDVFQEKRQFISRQLASYKDAFAKLKLLLSNEHQKAFSSMFR